MYHVHLVDESSTFYLTSKINAASLFAHLAFRCDNLNKHLLLSASVLEVNTETYNIDRSSIIEQRQQEGSNTMELLEIFVRGEHEDNSHNVQDSNVDDDNDEHIDEIIIANDNADENDEEEKLLKNIPFQRNVVPRNIYLYKYFKSSFNDAELCLRSAYTGVHNFHLEDNHSKVVAPYFDFIIATSSSAFDQLVEFYYDDINNNNYTNSNNIDFLLIDKPVCILYLEYSSTHKTQSNLINYNSKPRNSVSSSSANDSDTRHALQRTINNTFNRAGDDASTLNACCLLQRFIEEIIGADHISNDNNDSNNNRNKSDKICDKSQWLERVDDTVLHFEHEYGVRVLYSIINL